MLTTYDYPAGSVACASMPELRKAIKVTQATYSKTPTTSPVFNPAKPYCIDPGTGLTYFGTAREIKGLPQVYDGRLENLIPLIMGFHEEMEHMKVAPDMVDRRKPKESRTEEVERILEIVFPSDSDGLLIRRDEIEEALDEALTEADVGEIMGAGGSSDGSFDLAATVNPRRIKSALRIIRKILLKFKAPDTVKILEQHPGHEEPIEHGIHSSARE